MIDAKTIEELRGLLVAATSTDWQTIRADPAEGADVWWICAKNAAGQEVELGSLQGGFPHPTREARARLIVAMRNALPELLDLAASLASAGEDGLCKALTSYQQADEEGVMVLVSRQACDEAATRIRALASQVDGLRREIEIRDPVAKRREEQLSALRAENERLRKALADDLRAGGWAVAVHNDYRLNGEAHTFWLFTKDGRAIEGEGLSDAEALDEVRRARSELEAGHE